MLWRVTVCSGTHSFDETSHSSSDANICREGAIRRTPVLSNWLLMKACSYSHRKRKIWPASGEFFGDDGLCRFLLGSSALLLENAPQKTSILLIRTARNRTLQSKKLIDFCSMWPSGSPEWPSWCGLPPHKGACGQRRNRLQIRTLLKGLAPELLKTSRMRRLRGLLKMSVWAGVEDREKGREGERPGGGGCRPRTAVETKRGPVGQEGGPM